MSQARRHIPLPLIGTALLFLLASISWFSKKRFLKPKRSSSIVNHKAEGSPEDALKYWTAEKMHDARPAPLPNVDAHKAGEPDRQHPSDPKHT